MATEPDDIVVDAAEPADTRVQENIPAHRSFEAVQSIAQAVKKSAGQCRMVVEYPFDFAPEWLKSEGDRLQGRKFLDGVEYLRFVKKTWETGELSLLDLEDLSLSHSDNGIRMDAAK